MDQIPLFKWRNCHGDVICNRFDAVIIAYWERVALPSIVNAEAEVAFWASRSDGGAIFAHADVVDQQLVTASAMCLSLQSIWERQLRAYLLSCAGWANAKLTYQLQHDPWEKLQSSFTQLRGVPMAGFLSYPALDLLARLGNVCRHGSGKAANALWTLHPEFWPNSQWSAGSASAPPVEHMHIGKDVLASFVRAIADFWQTIEHLYLESIEKKHISVESTMPERRHRYAAAVAHLNHVYRSKASEGCADPER